MHAAGLAGQRFRARAPFALILANILLAPLQQLARPMARLVVPGGGIVLSGLLPAQAAGARRLSARTASLCGRAGWKAG